MLQLSHWCDSVVAAAGGEAAGQALADVLFGVHNPSGNNP